MRYLFEAIMTAVLAFVFGCFVWAIAHLTVAHECETLGAFYIGNKAYECKRKQKEVRDAYQNR